MEQMQTQELISALADGQLRGDAFARCMDAVARDPAALQAWQSYQVIGDVLRSSELAAGTLPSVFLSRFQSRLRQEPRPAAATVACADVVLRALPQSSNDASFRWKLVAGVASLAAIGAIAWSNVGDAGKPEQAQLAAVPTGIAAGTLPVANAPGMIRDPRLDEFLAAHRQLGGASALQTPAGFLRNAAFEGSSR